MGRWSHVSLSFLLFFLFLSSLSSLFRALSPLVAPSLAVVRFDRFSALPLFFFCDVFAPFPPGLEILLCSPHCLTPSFQRFFALSGSLFRVFHPVTPASATSLPALTYFSLAVLCPALAWLLGCDFYVVPGFTSILRVRFFRALPDS